MKLLNLGIMAGALFFAPVEANDVPTTDVVTSEPTTEDSTITSEPTTEDSTITSEPTTTPDGSTTTDEEQGFDFGKWMQENFPPEVIASIMSVLTSLAVVFKLAASLKDLAKKKSITTEEVCAKVVEILQTTNKDSIDKAINETVKPLEQKVGDITPVLNSFAKILALSQENTPESRLAILELIQSIGNVSDKVVEDAKLEIQNQVEEKEKNKQETVELLEDIEDKNANAEGRY